MDSAIQTADSRMTYVIRDDEEMLAYDRYMKAACDRTAEINFARSEGHAQGHAQGIAEEQKRNQAQLADKDAEIARLKAELEKRK